MKTPVQRAPPSPLHCNEALMHVANTVLHEGMHERYPGVHAAMEVNVFDVVPSSRLHAVPFLVVIPEISNSCHS